MSKRLYIKGSAADRFHARLSPVNRRNGMSPCHEWQGHRNRKGYGWFNAGTGKDPRQVLAHRFALELIGQLDDRPILHLCDNPPCCNPDHLRSGSLAENNADMRDKGRQARGERVASSRLTEPQAREIIRRRAMGEPVVRIAADFRHVAYRTVANCAAGDRWGHLHRIEAEAHL